MSTDVHFTRFGTGNLTELPKRSLYPQAQRAERALDLIDANKISMFGFQEGGTFLKNAARDHDYLRVLLATPNEVRGEGQHRRTRGNGLVYDEREWRLERDRDLRLMIPDGPARRPSPDKKRAINQNRARFTHIPSGRNVRVWCVHKPRDVRGYQNARGRLDGRLDAAAEYWDDHDLLAVILGDFNGAPPYLPGMRRRASHGPDSIVATAGLDHRGVRHHPLGRISDHHMAVSIELAIPERRSLAWRPAS